MSYEGTFSAYLPTSSSVTNQTFTFIVVNNIGEGGMNLYPNGGDQIQNGGGSNPIFLPGSGNYNTQMISDGAGNWWITSQYT